MSDLNQIRKNIDTFERFKKDLERQQVKFPLDRASQTVVHKNLPVPTGKITYPGSVNAYGAEALEVIVNGIRYLIKAKL
jgi:hypothetical protein